MRELEFTIEPCFASMARNPWREVEYVSSESGYVAELAKALNTVVDAVRDGVEQKKYVRSTCDKIVGCVFLLWAVLRLELACSLSACAADSSSPNSPRLSSGVVPSHKLVQSRCVFPIVKSQFAAPHAHLLCHYRSSSTCKASRIPSCTLSSRPGTLHLYQHRE